MTEALLIDLGGVLYDTDTPIPGALDTVRWMEQRKLPHLWLTNTTSRSRAGLVAKLAAIGIDVPAERVLTPAVAAVSWLRANTLRRVALYVTDDTRTEFSGFEEVDDERVQAVVVGDLGEAWDYARLNRAFQLLMYDVPPRLLALGMTRYWRGASGLQLDVAPFVAALAHASGAVPVVLGKPAEPFFRAALERLGVAAGRALMIGDDLDADVGGAQAAGIRGLLVRTGKYHGIDASAAVTPDAVLDSFADLPRWWAQQSGP